MRREQALAAMTNYGEAYLEFGSAMDDAVKERQLPNPGMGSDAAKSNESDSDAYLKALRERMIRLGYLNAGGTDASADHPIRDEHGRVKPVIVEAIKRFQCDIWPDKEQMQDGWLGPKSWLVSQCLVSFEDNQDPREWQKLWETDLSLLQCNAVIRAVYLRLSSLGFFAGGNRPSVPANDGWCRDFPVELSQAIGLFDDFASAINQKKPGSNRFDVRQITFEFLECLFGQDQIIQHIELNPGVFGNPKFKYVLEYIAQVELWLLGYQAGMGTSLAPTKKKVNIAGKTSRIVEMESDGHKQFGKSVQEFWSDHCQANPDVIVNDTAAISPELFQALCSYSVDADDDQKESGSDIQIMETSLHTIVSQEKTKQTLIDHLQRIASSIWDGIKRAARWLARLVKKVVEFSSTTIWNVARQLSYHARRFYLTVVKAVDIIAAGATYLRDSLLDVSIDGQMYIYKGKDFDQSAFVYRTSDPGQVRKVMAGYSNQTKVYAAACIILSKVINIFIRLANVFKGVVGWIGGLLALAKLRQSWNVIEDQVQIVRNHEINYSHSTAIFGNSIS